jgi:hypothetical protein
MPSMLDDEDHSGECASVEDVDVAHQVAGSTS